MRQVYAAYAAADFDWIVGAFAEDITFHVAGGHPLSGDHHGRDAVLTYFLEVGRISGGRGGFDLERVFADDDLGVALVQGTAYNGEEPFTRPIIHMARLVNNQLVEIWDNPFDQQAEDEFWTAAVADNPPS
jgi:ketosteroid isomerase-like protein